MNDDKIVVLKAQEPAAPLNKIHLKLKPLLIDEVEGISTILVWEKINQIVFMLNELNIRISKDDEVAMKKWADFMEANK